MSPRAGDTRRAVDPTDAAAGSSGAGDTPHADRADRIAERLALPVLIAALASVPAVFLTLLDDPWFRVGAGLNTLSGGVLVAETIVLLALAEDRRAWLRRNRWMVALAVAIVPAVLFAIGPVQLLRLLRVAGALRIIRVGRILKAGRIVRQRAGLEGRWQRVIGVGVTALCAGFVALVLVDPTSTSRQFLDGALDRLGWIGVVVAGAILAGATWVVRTQRQRDNDAGGDSDAERENDAEPPHGNGPTPPPGTRR